MDAVVMCGGRGTRLDGAEEKPLVDVGGRPMVDRVLAALVGRADDHGRRPALDRVVAAVSPHVPATADHLRDRGDRVRVVETPGDGYVPDLQDALGAVDRPALTVAADLPLLAPDAVAAVRRAHDRLAPAGSLTVRVPRELKASLGASVDDGVAFEDGGTDYLPAGINVVGPEGGSDPGGTTPTEAMYTTYDARLAVNVNRRPDIALAEALLCD